MFAYLARGTALQVPGREFAYDALAMVAANVFGDGQWSTCTKNSACVFTKPACCANWWRGTVSRAYRTAYVRPSIFSASGRKGVRGRKRVGGAPRRYRGGETCVKEYNDVTDIRRADECCAAVAVFASSQCDAADPWNFVARYGGEEFAVAVRASPRITWPRC